jgi:hypothetical protein
MSNGVEVIKTVNRRAELAAAMEAAAEEAVAEAAKETVTLWRQGITAQRAVDSGAYLDSIYTDAPGGRSYAEAAAAASSAANAKGRKFKPLPNRSGRGGRKVKTYMVSSAAFYHHMVEFGTVRMAARPAAMPAHKKVRASIRNRAEIILARKMR